MLFNSAPFILVFLPVSLVGFRLLLWRGGEREVVGWLLLLSLAFYGYWNWRFLPILMGSILANYAIGALLQRVSTRPRRRLWLIVGLVLNLGALFVFKYADFDRRRARRRDRLARGSRPYRAADWHLVLYLPAGRLSDRRLAGRRGGERIFSDTRSSSASFPSSSPDQ